MQTKRNLTSDTLTKQLHKDALAAESSRETVCLYSSHNMGALGGQFIQEMHELSEKGGCQKIKQFEQDLEMAEKRISEIDNVIMKLFEQNALGKTSNERFEKMSSAYENDQKELTQKRNERKEKIRAEKKKNLIDIMGNIILAQWRSCLQDM